MKCEILTEFCRRNERAHLVRGTKKRDPRFHVCLACAAILRRNGVKLIQLNFKELL